MPERSARRYPQASAAPSRGVDEPVVLHRREGEPRQHESVDAAVGIRKPAAQCGVQLKVRGNVVLRHQRIPQPRRGFVRQGEPGTAQQPVEHRQGRQPLDAVDVLVGGGMMEDRVVRLDRIRIAGREVAHMDEIVPEAQHARDFIRGVLHQQHADQFRPGAAADVVAVLACGGIEIRKRTEARIPGDGPLVVAQPAACAQLVAHQEHGVGVRVDANQVIGRAQRAARGPALIRQVIQQQHDPPARFGAGIAPVVQRQRGQDVLAGLLVGASEFGGMFVPRGEQGHPGDAAGRLLEPQRLPLAVGSRDPAIEVLDEGWSRRNGFGIHIAGCQQQALVACFYSCEVLMVVIGGAAVQRCAGEPVEQFPCREHPVMIGSGRVLAVHELPVGMAFRRHEGDQLQHVEVDAVAGHAG